MTDLRAPVGKYRVVGVDTFDQPTDDDWVYGDYETLAQAMDVADEHGGPTNVCHVYDEFGQHWYQTGTV